MTHDSFSFFSRMRQMCFTRRAALGALLAACALGSTAVLTGCGPREPPFQNLDITGNSQFAHDFSLPDTSGTTRTLSDYKGKVIVLVFGYTHCPDVCPTTLAELAQTLQQLGPQDAKRVQVLFMTVDPQRDTASLLAHYVHAFDASFGALRPANDAQLKQVTNSFHISYTKNPAPPGTPPDNYTMTHTAVSLVFDASGKLRLLVRDGEGVTSWIHDLKLLLGLAQSG